MPVSRDKKRLGDILVDQNVITSKQLANALEVSKEAPNKGKKRLGEILVELGYTTEESIASALAMQLGFKLVDVSIISIPQNVIDLCSESVLRRHIMIPYAFDEENPNVVHLAMADPMDLTAIDDFSIITNLQVEPSVSTPRNIYLALDKYYGHSEAMRAVNEYARERQDIEKKQEEEEEAAKQEVNNSPIVLLVNSMIEQAARRRASDIHIEALEEKVRVRFRIDGTLYERFSYNISLLPAIIARIKIMGAMDISERRKPQDGRVTAIVDKIEYDIRASVLPTVYGEKCVLRLQQKRALTRDKKRLGFSNTDLLKFDNILKNTYGIMLVTGPTGSGKSTTLYTALSELNRESVNIITVEDPVEANIEGVNQVQVNPKAGLTFATALRSILRQDPDIIMIGEIRDEETANIAVQASITGHLVVSTLHTNDAATTVTRLVDMGVPTYLVSDALVGIIAQRLVRCLCPNCREAYEADMEQKLRLGVNPDEDLILYRPKGCSKCDGMGYKGRTGIYEIMTMTPRLKTMISEGATAEAIEAEAVREGMTTLRESAKRLVLKGVTSYEEMLRVTYDNELSADLDFGDKG